MGFLDKLKDVNEMRKQAKQIELTLGQVDITGKSGGGKITIVMDGNQNIKSVQVDDSIVGDRGDIARNIRTALEDLFKQHKKVLQSKFGNMMQ